MEIHAKTRSRTSKMRKRDFMGQHYLQHGRAEGRVEEKNNTRGSARPCSCPCWGSGVVLLFYTAFSTAVLKVVLTHKISFPHFWRSWPCFCTYFHEFFQMSFLIPEIRNQVFKYLFLIKIHLKPYKIVSNEYWD